MSVKFNLVSTGTVGLQVSWEKMMLRTIWRLVHDNDSHQLVQIRNGRINSNLPTVKWLYCYLSTCRIASCPDYILLSCMHRIIAVYVYLLMIRWDEMRSCASPRVALIFHFTGTIRVNPPRKYEDEVVEEQYTEYSTSLYTARHTKSQWYLQSFNALH